MSDEKRRCPNCGAYLTQNDTECYVCGEVLSSADDEFEQILRSEEPKKEEHRTMVEKFEHNNEYTRELDEKRDEPYEDEPSYSEDEYSDPYEYDEYDEQREKSDPKKVALICGICVGVVALIAVICGCWFTGVFGGGDDDGEYTVYFDKPSVNINLMDENGRVYNWGADALLSYTDKKGVEQTVACSPMLEYDNLWKCDVPADATQVYFYQNGDTKLRTQILPELLDEQVYYVTQILLNDELELPVASCSLDEFDGYGVNATEETSPEQTAEETTEKPTEAKPEPDTTEPESTEPETEGTTAEDPGRDRYTVSVPSAWEEGTTIIEKGNCTTYYETYNYNNYQSGMLLSIYVYDSGDNSYGDMNVKKVLTTSDGQKKIVIVTPSDVEFDDSDETAAENYVNLSNLSKQVIDSIKAN